jgi:signal transduction histidine kinase
LVEDSPSDAALIREALNEAGGQTFEFVLADSWAAALNQLHAAPFDVLLLDLSLPDSTGRDTFLRARAAAPELPIVVMSGIADEAISVEAVRHGVQDYLVKGQADGPQTARAIRYAIERQRSEAALKRTEAALRESEARLREWSGELERRVLERTAELERTVADLEDMSYTITHDLRAPLRAMTSFCQLLGEECRACDWPAAEDYSRRIIAAARRMDQLIQDVLQYGRFAKSEVGLAPVDPAPLLHSIVQSYPSLQVPGVAIRIEPPLPRVIANEAALTQCFSNLLGNAVKFVTPGAAPRIRIYAESVAHSEFGAREQPQGHASKPRHPLVRIWVEDNGIGIPRESQERIFKLFERLDRAYEGTGVGLAVVRKAVEKMGGRVGVESAPGRGSRFWLELKLALDPAEAASSPLPVGGEPARNLA